MSRPVVDFEKLFAAAGRRAIAGLPEGMDALFLADLARSGTAPEILHIARDDLRLATLREALGVFAPEVEVLEFPAWDCVPYDRVSPNVEIVARRIDTLSRLGQPRTGKEGPRILLATVGAVVQRVPRREALGEVVFAIRLGGTVDMEDLSLYLARNGYGRAEQVMEPGEYAVRGGIVDLFPPGSDEPFRVDLFGDEVDGIRTFDPMTQRTTGKAEQVLLKPMSEVFLDDESIARFRTGYRELFGAATGGDPLYESISEGRRFNGMEHWLPLFHDGLDTLFAYVPEAVVTLDHQALEARDSRLEMVAEYYEARRSLSDQNMAEGGFVYRPVPPEHLYLGGDEFERLLNARPHGLFSPFAAPDVGSTAVDVGGLTGRDFADVRARPGENVYDALRQHIVGQQKDGRTVVVCCYSAGSRDRIGGVMREHGIAGLEYVDAWADALKVGTGGVAMLVLGLEHGFVGPRVALISEQDVLGDRLARPARKKKKSDKFIQDVSALSEGDLVVHVEHGIGRYDGLETLQVGGAPHDCLRLIYEGGDKLFLPVENIDVLSRYGSETAGVQLDRLGSPAWQARKAKLKERIRDMAEQLIRIAAVRQLKPAQSMTPAEGLWDEFCARFPYTETEDQLKAISDTIDDLGKGRPMDRLVCGDVGFGKTEVALRAAFVAAMSGMQVAVVVPTTLLARQHYRAFLERFQGMPVRIEQLSRLVTAKNATAAKKGLADGTVDIIVGTHAVLAKSVSFKRLGLVIVDEEQHFGVAHKERLKQFRSDVHVLTLTATPIPRTLQLALTGVRELSIIATPPVDRLAVRTFVLPFDGVVIREAILRERYRNGQCFYVCPRLSDIDRVADRLSRLVPEVKVAIAHGQMAPTQLEEVMTAFADGQYDILLATNIIESGLDMPSVNTIIVHRADMFGLAQLYQLRGRVGRGKARGYAYLTLPPSKPLTPAAEKRLQVMQTLDTLGAGFNLASHDLDIRGAGNLLGDEQSGHIKEVGIELYQHLLEEAVAAAKSGEGLGEEVASDWAPSINLGTAVLIPETYVKDLGLRLSLYRRIGDVTDSQEIEALAVEMIDRFGPLPPEVENLLEIVAIKAYCRIACVEKLDAGPKGAVVGFRENKFPNPAGLVRFISQQVGTVKVRPDHRLVVQRKWETPKERIDGAKRLLKTLADLAQQDG